jgi:hypothetical protein
MFGIVLLAVLLVLSVISIAWGVDSRDASMDPRRPIYPIGLR